MSFPWFPVLREPRAPAPANAASGSAPPAATVRGSALRAFQSEDFKIYFVGSILSNFGTWLQNTAQVLLAYRLTHSVFVVGLVTCVQFSSSLVMGPVAAVVADRIGGRRMLIGAQIFSAGVSGCMAGMQLAGVLGEKALLAGALLLGLAFTFALPVQTALLPRLVGEADTEAAMTMNSISYNIGRAAAPLLCVLLVASRAGFAAAFVLNAFSFLLYAFLLWRIRIPGKPAATTRARLWTGLHIAMQRPRILLLLAIVAAVTFADDPILVLGPSVARHLNASSDWAGYFLSALGAGTILGIARGATGPARWQPRRASRRAAGWLIALFACMALFVFSPWKQVTLAAALLAGTAGLRTGVVAQTQLVRPGWRTSEAEAASVMALWSIAWAGTKPIASIADGWLANSWVGVRGAALILAAPALLLGLAELSLRGKWKARIRDFPKKLAPPLGERPATGDAKPAGV